MAVTVNDNIKRNSNEFSFVDRLGSFINNYDFGVGYDQFAQGNPTDRAYVWNVLSAIGNEYAQTIYQNVLNYIDNAANVDLCKIKALKSMADILGLKYQIFDNIDIIPIEILNTLDVLSINKKYLLDSTTFCSAFREELSSFPGAIISDYNNTLGSELCDNFEDPSTGKLSSVADFNQVSTYIDFNNNNNIIEESYYGKFLKQVYSNLINHFVYLQYADRENGISNTLNEFIYQYIADKLMGVQSTTDQLEADEYDKKIAELKIKFKLTKKFDQVAIVDAIEYGLDDIKNYDDHEQEVIQVEIDRREDKYQYEKPYNEAEKMIGNNVTRYSYYREKKVKEYFDYIQTTYNNLITTTDIESAVRENPSAIIKVYDKDQNYFNLNQSQTYKLLSYDRDTQDVTINNSMIVRIVELLAQQTLELTEIREQLKIQMQRTYMKGTFLLLSYVINEYLKYNISDKYGDIFTQDGSASLRDFLETSIASKNNVKIIEYTDSTEYYNITAPESDISSENSALVNPKYWENEYNLIGIDTKDIPLDQISSYYMHQLHLDKRNVTDTTEFLSIIFEYGANGSFLDSHDIPVSSNLSAKETDYTCKLPDGSWCKDPDIEEAKLSNLVLSAQKLNDNVNEYVEAGYQLSNETIWRQMVHLSTYISSYYGDKISAANAQVKEDVFTTLGTNLEDLAQMSDDYEFMENEFNSLSSDSIYAIFLGSYSAPAISPNTFIRKLEALLSAVSTETHGVKFDHSKLTSEVQDLEDRYDQLASDFIENTIKLSVLDLWPTYTTLQSYEITAQTAKLQTFLNNQASLIDSEIAQHMQNHLDQLIVYKSELVSMIDTFIDVSAMYENFENTIANNTGYAITSSIDFSGKEYWTGVTGKATIINFDNKDNPINKDITISEYDTTTAYNKVDGLNKSDTIPQKLLKLKKRCELIVMNGGDAKSGWYYKGSSDFGHGWSWNKNVDWYVRSEKTLPNGRQAWLNYFSTEITSAINTNLNKLKSELGTVVIPRINDELTCLGYETIPPAGITTENIGDKLNESLTKLVSRISALDDAIRTKTYSSDDVFIRSNSSKTQRIKDLMNSDPTTYNIAYIENEFFRIDTDFSKLKAKQSDFLNGYFYSRNGTLKDQFQDLVEHVAQRCSSIKQEILDKLGSMRESYDLKISALKAFSVGLYRTVVEDILDTKEYVLKTSKYSEEVEFLDDSLNQIQKWLNDSFDAFETSSQRCIKVKCVQDPEYILTQILIALCYSYLKSDSASIDLLPIRLEKLIQFFKNRSDYIEQNREFYSSQKRTFLQYSGTEFGDDPYFNHKNLTHPSYQIHPYLFNFVKKTNLGYPIANLFHLAFSQNYEQELIDIGIDNLIGKYGNIINLWKYGMYDWSGYRSQYEAQLNVNEQNSKETELIGFTGLFYPKALYEFLDNPEVFIQKVLLNEPDSYYFHLNLTDEQCYKIADQLRTYQDQIRIIAQRTLDQQNSPSLSGEFDIYRYGEDVYGNAIILLKDYSKIWEQNGGNPPTFNQKKNTPGELWMRIKNHPIAFPAFDLRSTFDDDVSQYNVKVQINKKGKKLNNYITRINEAYRKNKVFELESTIPDQFLRCFYDMEFDTTNRTLLLNVPYKTGTDGQEIDKTVMSYANSSVIVGVLHQEFDYNQNMMVYSFTDDSEVNVDNIANPGILINQFTSSKSQVKYDFMGFIKNNAYVYAMFIQKQFGTENDGLFPQTRSGKPSINIKPVGYKYNTALYRPNTDIVVSDALYNIFDKSKVGDQAQSFDNATNVAIACDGENITIAYISEQVQPVKRDLNSGNKYDITDGEPYNKNNVTVVNYAEYTPTVESRSISSFGENTSYPSSTAILQTQDDQHAVIYNSFDSFTSYIVTMMFTFSGHALKYAGTKYYNLNTDIGFMPLFADEQGTTRIFKNKSIAQDEQYNLQLQGPEKAEENATPVIIDPADEKYGRVTEDYKEYNKFTAFNETQISILAGQTSAEYTFELSSVLSAIYYDVKQTNQLVKYKYMLMNSKYTTMPIAKGGFNRPDPTGYYYNGYEEFDLLSGQELIGPNGVSYQNVGSTNHINNISSIDVKANIDDNTLLPTSISLTCHSRVAAEETQVIDANQFTLMVYNKNNVKAYDFYRILQNSNLQLSSLLSDDLSSMPGLREDLLAEIDFSEISSLSTYTVPGTTIMPFAAHSSKDDPKYTEMSALLEFKYSEENTINSEFPYLDSEDIEDEVTIVTNDKQYSYFFALDSFDTIQTDLFKMKKFDPESKTYINIDVNTRSGKYADFYNRALTIEATYNVEVVNEQIEVGKPGHYGMVLYFNYKNFTETPYINIEYKDAPNPPEWNHYAANDDSIKHTFLRLEPGQTGRLDLLVDYLEFDKVDPQSITQTVVGKESRVIASYYILNVSQDKPKFKISRTAFKVEDNAWQVKAKSEEEAYQWYRPDDNDGSGDGSGLQNQKMSIDAATVTGIDTQYEYAGSEIKPSGMTVTLDKTVLIQNIDYDIVYPSDNYVNVSLGNKVVRFIGKNTTFSYKDCLFSIVPRKVTNVDVTGVYDSYVYTGSPICPQPLLSYDSIKLVKGTDYSIAYYPEDCIQPGEKQIIITGSGNFGDKRIITYKITGDIVDASVEGIPSRVAYDNKSHKPQESDIIVSIGGTIIDRETSYDIEYPSADYKSPGVKQVRLVGKGSYYGTKDITFEISESFLKITLVNGSQLTYFDDQFSQPLAVMASETQLASPFNQRITSRTNIIKVEDPSGIVTSLSAGCFIGCSNMTTVNLPKVTNLPAKSFERSGLTSISLPECQRADCNNEFARCYGLKQVSLPKLTSDNLGSTFMGCESLTSIFINSSKVKSIADNTLVTNNDQTKLLAVAKRAVSAIDSTTLTSVNDDVFANSTSKIGRIPTNFINSINCPNLRVIGKSSFEGAQVQTFYAPAIQDVKEKGLAGSKFTSIYCPSLTAAGNESFYGSQLTSIDATSLQTAGTAAFATTQLRTANLPAAKTIGERAFESCTQLTSCTVGSTATSIGKKAFGSCSNLRELRIKTSSLSCMASDALEGCQLQNLCIDGVDSSYIINY